MYDQRFNLQNIGIIIDNDAKSLAVAGDPDTINTIFMRIERFVSKIHGANLNFDELVSSTNLLQPNESLDKSNGRRGKPPVQKKSK